MNILEEINLIISIIQLRIVEPIENCYDAESTTYKWRLIIGKDGFTTVGVFAA
jgi:hypothetical protein